MKSEIRRISVFAILTVGFLGMLQTASAEVSKAQFMSVMRSSDGAQAQSDKEEAIQIGHKDGYLCRLAAPMGHYFQVSNVVANDSAATAKNFIAERGAEFGIKSQQVDFSQKKSRKQKGRSYERFQQTYSQIPVFGAEVIVQLNASSGVEFVVSDIMRNTSALDNGTVSTVPTILAADASYLAIALMAQTHQGLQLRSAPPQLMIYQPAVVGNTGSTCLVWKTEVTNTSTLQPLVDEIVLVNAHTGGIALHFTNIKSAMDREIYDAASSNTVTLVRSEGDPATGIADADSCYDLFSDVYNFYFNEHGRDSIDNAGMTLIGVVRYCPDSLNCPYLNAGWGGGLMVFGEGFVVDDVTAHEMTHGVTQYESDLIYQNESGAINESFSDMWGEWVDLTNGTGTDTPAVRWLIGEDIPGIGAIRNMANPPQFGDPDSKCSPLWYTGTGDNGGVHWNSGVGNKLCYLLTDGDVFKGVTILGMGIPAIADLMYEVQTNLLTSGSDYADLHAALTQAAINLGWTSYNRYNLEVACFVTELSACFDAANLPVYVETDPPTPNQMTWEIKPTATGLHHIVMKAVKATDESGVEYYFDCIEDDAFDSVQDGQFYERGKPGDVKMPEAGKTYTFRVQARDKSANHNVTLWSEAISTTTAATVDNLPPAPGPVSAWSAKPHKYIFRRTQETIFMQAGESYDESGLQYFFDCIWTNDPAVLANDLDKTQTTRDYMVNVAKVHQGYRYTFVLVIRDALGNALQPSPAVTVSFETVITPRVLKVPLIFPTIQTAIDAALDGDVVEVQSNRTYRGVGNRNLDFGGKAITVRSENPQDPAIVASTIIDCQGTQNADTDHSVRRAFIFQTGEEPNSIVSGLTIINAYAVNNPRSASAGAGLSARGGAILCQNGSSPTISKCVIRDCYAQGQDGEAGSPTTPGARGANGTAVPYDPNGKDGEKGDDVTSTGGAGGNGYGGAVYCDFESSPVIVECTIENAQAVGGSGGASIGGTGGDGGDGYVPDPNLPAPTGPNLINTDGGRGGDGGAGGIGGGGGIGAGGALYFESQCEVKIVNCTILNCSAILGAGGQGGTGGAGGNGGQPNGNGTSKGPGNPGPTVGGPGVDGYADGGAVFIGTGCSIYFSDNTRFENNVADTNGGSVFMAPSSRAYFNDCIINGNTTQSGDGGAIYTSANALSNFAACEFTANTSGSEGGAIYFSGNTVSDCNNCNFIANTSSAGGGAVFANKPMNLSFTESVFSENTNTDGHGGAVYANDPVEIHFTNSQFTRNKVSGGRDGGAIYYRPDLNKTAIFEAAGCTFELNTAGIDTDPTEAGAGDLYGNGGAININPNWIVYDPSLDISVTDCNFIGNDSDTGGAIFAWYTDVAIDKCIFSGNISEYGGGLFWYMADFTITNSSFDNNLAQNTDGPAGVNSGGALYCLDASARVYNSKFAENGANFSGGAISLVGTFAYVAGGTQDFYNCLMVENTAVDSGGAVSVSDGAEPFMINCTMAGNKATGASGSGGAVSCIYYGDSYGWTYVLLENSILWDNKAELGPQAAVGHPLNLYNQFSMLELSYSDIEGGSEDVFRGQPQGNTAVYESGGVINANPLFVQATDPNQVIDRTYYLRQAAAGQLPESPCVNTGINSIIDLTTLLGFNVTTRTDHVADSGIMDMGFHYDAALPVLEYTLTTAIYIRDYLPYGTIEAPWAPGTYTVKQGTIVQLVAKPDPGYRVARWIGTDNDQSYELTNTVTMSGNRTVQVEFELAVPKNLYVPDSYDTIEDALLAARSGDRIILAPRPDAPYLIADPDGINFGGKSLVITSVDPNDPLIIASTIIDCQGSRYVSKRAFHFENGENADSRVEGVTIQNAFTAVIGRSGVVFTGRWPWWVGAVPPPWTEDPASPSPLPPFRAMSGEDGTGDSYGGAVLCENGSSPVIRNCVFKNCTVSGGIGGDGADGDWPANLQNVTDDRDSQSGGHSGKGTGNGYGGAIAVMSGSNPQILNCEFQNNRATGGWGGIPGNAGRSYNNGRYGWGGNDPEGIAWATEYGVNPEAGYGEGDGRGGAIFVAAGCHPVISQGTFEGNYARPGYVSQGGARGAGSAYPEPYAANPYARDGYRIGRDGRLNFDKVVGGAIFIEEEANVEIEECQFLENQAYRVFTYNDSPVSTRGGAVFSDPNAVVKIGNSVFSGNLAGAIYCTTGVNLRVEDAEFTQNSTYIPSETQSNILSGSSTVTPTGDFDIGGAVTVDPNAAAASVFINCQFLNNASHTGGGAIRTLSDIDLTDCVLSGNQSLGDGGAIYSFVDVGSPNTHTTRMTIENCEFGGNSAQGLGGAAFVKNVILTMNDSFLVMNNAFSGGGLRASYSDLDMRGCLIYGNEATGAVAGAHRTVTEEGFGGGLHIVDSPLKITDTRIENNTAGGIISSGGGLCITGSQTYYNQSLSNCLFADNKSDNAGGGVSSQLYVNVGFDNCTFANNTSVGNLGGALYVDRLSNVEVNNSIVSGNAGIGIYEKPGGNSQVDYTLFYSNTGGDMLNGSNGVIYSANAAPGYTNITIGDPQFATDPLKLGNYYLKQATSPAVDKGSMTALAAGLNKFTTDPNGMLDAGQVDLGYHYEDPTGIPTFGLTTSVIDDAGQVTTGTVTPGSGTYRRGAIVELSADVGKDYFLTGWSGGTFNDGSQDNKNWILMSGDKDIKVLVRLRRTLNVGTSSQYDLLGDAITDAQDGDIILVAPGEYVAGSQFGTMTNSIVLDGKKITIAGYNPNDEAAVRATIFRDFRFIISNVNNQTIIEGITINQSRMLLTNADMIIRNCVFSNCRFGDATLVHAPPVAAGTDGYSQPPTTSGALQLWDSSPAIIGCTFENNAVFGIDAEDGFAGAQSHPTGGDGGWPGGAYGGAVYCGFSSSPEFIGCTFTGNEVFGGNGGNGANGWVDRGVTYNGGRGGGWVYDDVIEQYLRTAVNGGWDGWANNAYGDKYSAYSIYAGYYGAYDLDLWAKWFSWGDSYSSWEQFAADYLNDSYDPLGDPYDQMQDVWRYSGYGGAVYCEFESGAKFTDCVFENNQSHGGLTGVGGLIYMQTSWPDRQLNMPTAGGAVFAANDSDVEFTNCQFRGNIADISTVELPHTFQVSFGGAVAYQYDCKVTFTNCDLTGNNATVGGAVYGFETSTVISDCNVFDNEAYIGAGVYSEDYDILVNGTTFRSNRAVTPAALTPPAESLDLTGEAGGLFAMIDTLDIRDSVFIGNSADISGAGLLLTGVATRPTNVFNCLFAGNTSGHDGAGASVNWSHQAKFGNCTFADNGVSGTSGSSGSGGGLYCASDSKVEVKDSIFWGNTALLGNQLAITSGTRPSTLTVSYCDVQGGKPGVYVESGCTLIWDTNVLSEDPLFVTTTTGNYYLSQINAEQPNLLQDVNSPCLDAGSDLASNLGLTYYTTATVPLDDTGTVDIGYHYPGSGSAGYYILTPSTIGQGTLTLSPQAVGYAYGTEVTLTATPNSGWRVKKWTGADDDFSLANQNKVMMTSNRTVSVEFEAYTPKIILVPSSYATIEEAVNAAFSGDTIILSPNSGTPYTISATDGIDFRGKSVILTSIDPTNPQVVQSTIIDCQGAKFTPKRAFYFHSGEGSNTIIKGISILNAYTVGQRGISGYIVNAPFPPGQADPQPPLRANSGENAAGDGYGGAVLCENSSSPIFQNCIFAKCTIAGGVGGDGNDGYGIIDGATGDAQSGGLGGNGSGFGYGGVVACLKGSSPRFEDCSFIGNGAMGGIGGDGGNGGRNLGSGRGSWGGSGGNSIGDGMGGAVYSEGRSEPNFVRCVFEENYAAQGPRSSGGALGTGGAYPDPWDEFTSGANGQIFIYDRIAGGAVYAATNSMPKFTDCTFTGNAAYEEIPSPNVFERNQKVYTRGGAMYFEKGNNVKLIRDTFTRNMGGAIYCEAENTFEVDYCIFIENQVPARVDYNGTAVGYSLDLGYPHIPGYAYTLTYPTSGGGALFVDRNSTVVLKNSQFRNNSTYLDGGAIRTRSNIKLIGCEIGGNTAEGLGGGIAIFFDPNTLAGETGFQTVSLNFEDCLLGGNRATVGGGVYAKHVTVQGSSTYVMGNAADQGGGFYMTESQATLTNGIMNGNQALARYGFGGAIAGMNTKLSIENHQFNNNKADGEDAYGGGIYISGCGVLTDRDTFHTIKNCLFAGNSAGVGGGAVSAMLYASPTMRNCTFDKNTAVTGGAVFCDWSSTAIVKDSIVANNTGNAIYEQNTGKSQLLYSLFYENRNFDLYNSGSATGYTGAAQLNGIAGNAGNRNGDPNFIVGGLGAYLLASGSPAIDAGSGPASDPNIGMDSYTTQTDGTPDSLQVDMGYHYAPDVLDALKVKLNVIVDGGHAMVSASPADSSNLTDPVTQTLSYVSGTAVALTVTPDSGYRVASWSGNTVNDSSRNLTNTVIMGIDRTIVIRMELPRTLTVGSQAQYSSIQAAIDDADEGDVVLIEPGLYEPDVNVYTNVFRRILLNNKNITLTSKNPNDSDVVANTVLRGYEIGFVGVGSETIINGLTITAGISGVTSPTPAGAGNDGPDGSSVTGGAMMMVKSSPTIKNCIFRDCFVQGGNGNNGNAGSTSHISGGDGGWPGRAYGGAVYCGFSSNPTFQNCSFIGNSARGGNGGNGGDGATVANVRQHGGRGGAWTWSPSIEGDATTWSWWDGWTYGDKWDVGLIGYQLYDWNDWLKWFSNWDQFYNWNDWSVQIWGLDYENMALALSSYELNDFLYGSFSSSTSFDPYDRYDNYWEYSGYGGAVFCEYDSSPQFVQCRFEDNYTSGGTCGIGGLSYLIGMRTPNNNYDIENAGGAVFARYNSNLNFEGCTFTGNYADNSLADNTTDYYVSYGGAVAYEYDCDVTFKDCLLENNRACMGGGIYWLESKSAITDCNFIDNRAYDGGGIYITNSTGDILRTNIESNITTYDLQIGAQPPANVAQYIVGSGGGIYTVNALTNIRDSVFKENTASLSGGAIAYSGSDGDILKQSLLWNSLLIHNTAGRDGGAVSIDWYAETSVGNCTFSNNEATGLFGSTMESYGGGLSVNYESNASVINSIFWDNYAGHGNQFAVTSGFDLDPRPSTLTVSYCDVQGGRSSMAVYVEDGCQLNWDGATTFTADPLFVDVYNNDYHLSQYNSAYDVASQQETSPCVNVGSDLASSFGLERYTTAAPIPRNDDGKVDLGYHYRFDELPGGDDCPYSDLRKVYVVEVGEGLPHVHNLQPIDGIVDVKDLAILAYWWLSNCDKNNLWCDDADRSFSGNVDFLDFVYMAKCWQAEDTEAPSQAKWDTEPASKIPSDTRTILAVNRQMYYPDTDSSTPLGYLIDMSAQESTDNWRGGLFYKFEAYVNGVLDTNPMHTSFWMQNFDPNMIVNDLDDIVEDNEIVFIEPSNTDPNIVPWKWQSIQLVDQQEYVYRIRIRDPRGMALANGLNETVSTEKSARAGTDQSPPDPDPAEWLTPPYQSGSNSISMVAVVAADAGGHGVEYSFECVENSGLNSGWRSSGLYPNPNEYTTPAVLVGGLTYTFQVRYRDTLGNTTGYSTAVAVTIAAMDMDPPTPDPTTLTVSWWQQGSTWYHILVAGVVTDATQITYNGVVYDGVEYQFRCVDLPGLVAGTWYNVTNVFAEAYPPNSAYYPDLQTLKVPNIIWVYVGSGMTDHTYQVRTRDMSPNQNMSVNWSPEVTSP